MLWKEKKKERIRKLGVGRNLKSALTEVIFEQRSEGGGERRIPFKGNEQQVQQPLKQECFSEETSVARTRRLQERV